MTGFAIVACLMLALALLFVLPALVRTQGKDSRHIQRDEINLEVLRDQLHELDADLAAGTIGADAYDSARKELERRVVEDVVPGLPMQAAEKNRKPWAALAVGVAVPIIALSLYAYLGSPSALDPAKRVAPEQAAQGVTAEQVDAMVAKLAERLKSRPDDVQGWQMLARSYAALGKFGEAAQAYAHLIKIAPGKADVLADYADALGMSQGRTLQGEPEKLVMQALVADPKNPKALALAGTAAFERRDYAAAILQWKKLLTVVPADSESARATTAGISEAQNLMAGKQADKAPATPAAGSMPATPASVAAPTTAPATASVANPAASVEGTVELDPALRAQASDTDTVFIFARAAEGPRFPLAVLRKQVKDLPVSFKLDDSMSMMPEARLSGIPLVIVGARISKSGNATPSAGDLEGASEPVKPGARNLKIRITARRS
ncbi:c-type cytochrome biogenesis protein CcmI [soil metagenome]